MTQNVARERPYKTESEVALVAVSFDPKLDVGELLTGTPTVVEVTTSDLTLENKAVSTAELTIAGRTVALGRAVQFRVTGGTAGAGDGPKGEYVIRITCATDSTPAQTRIVTVYLTVVAD